MGCKRGNQEGTGTAVKTPPVLSVTTLGSPTCFSFKQEICHKLKKYLKNQCYCCLQFSVHGPNLIMASEREASLKLPEHRLGNHSQSLTIIHQMPEIQAIRKF